MCFNATIMMPLDEAQKAYNLKLDKDMEFNGFNTFKSAFTHPFLPIVLEDRVVALGKWGLIPGWVRECKKSEEIVKYTINARIETLEEKPSFKGSVNKGRIIVLLDGFYEWKHIGKKKIPYYVSARTGKPFLAAGLVSSWGGVNTFSIITTEAMGIMREVHNTKMRMPFILKEKDIDLWLNSGVPYKDVKGLISPDINIIQAVEQEPIY